MSRPDEGMIHAWLDGELDAADSARIEALVRDDPEWAAAAAEARGFIAASARIVGALDHVPANVIPKAPSAQSGVTPIGSARRPARGAPWWAMRVAALLVVAAGTAVVVRRAPEEAGVVSARDQAKVKPADVAVAPPAPRSFTAPAPLTANEADAGVRRGVGDAPRKQNAGGAPAGVGGLAAAPRDRLDERRTALADSADASGKVQAEVKSSDLKKDVAAAPFNARPNQLSQVVTTGVAAGAGGRASASPATSALADVSGSVNAALVEACYLEPPGPGTASVLHRVGRVDDSTAQAGVAAGSRAEETVFRARQTPRPTTARAAAPAAAPTPTVATAATAARMKVRGDTLFVAVTATSTRIALKTSCPPPE